MWRMSWLVVFAVLLVPLGNPVEADVDCPAVIQSMNDFAVRQMDWFNPPPPPPEVRPEGQPPLKQTFGWDTALAFPPDELNPPPCCASPCAPAPPAELKYRGDIYDQSLDAIWFTNRGELGRARDLLDAGIFVENHDPIADGRLRAAYWANNLLDPTGTEASIMDPDAGTGNIAFFGIALARFYHAAAGYLPPAERQTYLDTAVVKGDWILDHCTDSHPYGFTGGYGGWAQTPLTWKSTEHNIDVWTLGRNLYYLTGETKWKDMADRAAAFVQSMYVNVNDCTGYYHVGSLVDGVTPNDSPIAADAQAWTALARWGDVRIDTDERAKKAMHWLLQNLKDGCECDGLPSDGIKFSDIGKNVQCEMTASAAFALLWLGEGLPGCSSDFAGEADALLELLDWIRLNAAPDYDGVPDGIGIVATPCLEGAWTGFGDAWFYKLLHCASSDWFGSACVYAHEGDSMANPLRPIPEPTTLALLAMGGLALIRRKHT